MASKVNISSKVISTSSQPIISTALERSSIDRSSEQQSKIKTENKGFTSFAANSLSHNLGKINISRSNFNILSKKIKQHNINSSFIPSQTNFNKAQNPQLQTIRKSPIIGDFRQGNTVKKNLTLQLLILKFKDNPIYQILH